jgi:hypothetical protein
MMKRACILICVATLGAIAVRCTSAPGRSKVDVAPGDVVVVTEERYIHECQLLTWLPFRDAPLGGGLGVGQAESREVAKAGGNVLFLPGDKASLGRYAAYRCTEAQLRTIPAFRARN